MQTDRSLSINVTDLEGPATALVELSGPGVVSCTAMLRASAIFCFFLSRAVDSSLLLRLGAISRPGVGSVQTRRQPMDNLIYLVSWFQIGYFGYLITKSKLVIEYSREDPPGAGQVSDQEMCLANILFAGAENEHAKFPIGPFRLQLILDGDDLALSKMASLHRLPTAATRRAAIQTRSFSTQRVLRQDAPVAPIVADVGRTPVQKKPVGGFRGGCVFHPTFLINFAICPALFRF